MVIGLLLPPLPSAHFSPHSLSSFSYCSQTPLPPHFSFPIFPHHFFPPCFLLSHLISLLFLLSSLSPLPPPFIPSHPLFHHFHSPSLPLSPLLSPLSTDLDECALGTHSCEHWCHNNIGSYDCTCQEGYYLEANGWNCTGKYTTTTQLNSSLHA